MLDTADYVLTIRLNRWVSAAALANELSQHIAPLIARRCCCGDVVIDDDVKGDWALEQP
jgi:hypothetical protein